MIDRNEAIARIRKALKARSGKAWSVTGGKGTAWSWIHIDAPPARRTWKHVPTGERDESGFPVYTEVNEPGYEFGQMSPAERAELGQLLGEKDPVHHQGVSVSADAREYFVLAAEGKKIDLDERLAALQPGFRDCITALAEERGKAPTQVLEWWREYAATARAGDQSAIWDEFLTWYAAKLGPIRRSR